MSAKTEALEREVSRLLQRNAELVRDPGDLPVAGCGDNSCEVARPRGMATNGGCHCDPREVRRALRFYKRKLAFLEETIRILRAEPGPSTTASEERDAVLAYLAYQLATNYDEGTQGYDAIEQARSSIGRGLHKKAPAC